MAEESSSVDAGKSFLTELFSELITSPLNLALLGICGFLIYKINGSRKGSEPSEPKEPELPPLEKRDFTPEQLREYDGKSNDGRILIAVNGKVFDVTRGKRFYGPGGPYGIFSGRDASRALATFSLSQESLREGYDDLSDLGPAEMEGVRDWETQFTEKYVYVGKLLKPGEQPTEYSATDDEESSEKKGPSVKKAD